MTWAFSSLIDFLAMGTHGAYVWSAWGLVFLALIVLVVLSRRQRRHVKQQIAYQASRHTLDKSR